MGSLYRLYTTTVSKADSTLGMRSVGLRISERASTDRRPLPVTNAFQYAAHMDEDPSAMAGYVIHCADAVARSGLLRTAAARLLRVSEAGPVRLWSPGEMGSEAAGGALDVNTVQNMLRTKWAGRVVVRAVGAVRSTQDVLRGSFSGLMPGAVAVAAMQTGGRGRAGAGWDAPMGSLAFSMSVHVRREEARKLVFLQYVAAMAVVDAVRVMWGVKAGNNVRIKWPNDVLRRGGGKVAGVLCEAASGRDGFEVTVGVGVNVENESPGACVRAVVAETEGEEVARGVTREKFLGAYLNCFEEICDVFLEPGGGFTGELETRYLRDWMHSGQQVFLEDEAEKAIIVGIASSGSVRVRRENGTYRDLPPDITSLDLEKGVLRRKTGPREKAGVR